MLQYQHFQQLNRPYNSLTKNSAFHPPLSNSNNNTCPLYNPIVGQIKSYHLQDHLDHIAKNIYASNHLGYGLGKAISGTIENSSWVQNPPSSKMSTNFTEPQQIHVVNHTKENSGTLSLLSQKVCTNFMRFMNSWYNSCGIFWDMKIDMNTDIHRAICSQNYDQLSLAISQYSDQINTKNLWKIAPIHLAIEKRDLKCVKLLVQRGASLKIPGGWSHKYPGEMALEKGYMKIVHFIDSLGGSFDEGGSSLLHIYAEKGDLNAIKNLLDKENIDIKNRNRYGDTPLTLALQKIKKPLKPGEYKRLFLTIKYLVNKDPDLFNRQHLHSQLHSTEKYFRYSPFYEPMEKYFLKLDFEKQEKEVQKIEAYISSKFSKQFKIRHIDEFHMLSKVELRNTTGAIYLDTKGTPKRYFIQDSLTEKEFIQAYIASLTYQRILRKSILTNHMVINNFGKMLICTPIIQNDDSSLKMLVKDLIFELIMGKNYTNLRIFEWKSTKNNKQDNMRYSNQRLLGKDPLLGNQIKLLLNQPKVFIQKLLGLIPSMQKHRYLLSDSESNVSYINPIRAAIKELSTNDIDQIFLDLKPKFLYLDKILRGRYNCLFPGIFYKDIIKEQMDQLESLLESLKRINQYISSRKERTLTNHSSINQDRASIIKKTVLLHQYVKAGDLDKVKRLVENNPDINIKSKNSLGKTPLGSALKIKRTSLAFQKHFGLSKTIMYLIEQDPDLFNLQNKYSLFDSKRNLFSLTPFFDYNEQYPRRLKFNAPKEGSMQEIEYHISLIFAKQFNIRHINEFEWISHVFQHKFEGSILKDINDRKIFIQSPLRRRKFLDECITPILFQALMGYQNVTNEIIIDSWGKLLVGSPVISSSVDSSLNDSPELLIKSLLFEWVIGDYYSSMKKVYLGSANHNILETFITSPTLFYDPLKGKQTLKKKLPMLRQCKLFTPRFLGMVTDIQNGMKVESNITLNKTLYQLSIREISKVNLDVLFNQLKVKFENVDKIMIGRNSFGFHIVGWERNLNNLKDIIRSRVEYLKRVHQCLEKDLTLSNTLFKKKRSKVH